MDWPPLRLSEKPSVLGGTFISHLIIGLELDPSASPRSPVTRMSASR
jgi:hypothetical protein